MTRRIPLSIILAFLVYAALPAQEIHFSQFYNAPVFFNPALTGSSNCGLRIGTVYRSQWKNIGVPYKTIHAFGDVRIAPRFLRNDWIGIGAYINSDRAGDGNLRTTNTMLALSYNKSLAPQEKVVISIGLAGGITNKDINVSSLLFGSQWNGTSFDNNIQSGEVSLRPNSFHSDFNAGLLLTWKSGKNKAYHIGGVLNHIQKPVESFVHMDNQLDRKFLLHAGYSSLSRNYKFVWMPKIYLSMQNNTHELVLGTNFKYSPDPDIFHLGLWYRWGRDIIPTLGFNVKGFAFAFSYDINVSKLKKASNSNGGIELSLVKSFNCKGRSHHKKTKKESTYKNRSSKFEGCPAF